MKILVLGCGRVGLTIANDLAKTHDRWDICVVDSNQERLSLLEKGIQKTHSDITPNMVRNWAPAYNLIISAVPGHMGFNVAKAVIESRRHLVDISFFPEDAYELEDLANKNKVLAAFDCGIAPGFSNAILGHFESLYRDNIDKYVCYVGGLPFERTLPFEYKAGFSPSDVIEEYVRPARYIENGEIITKPALSDPELLHFDGIGTLEAFNSDGLRTMLQRRKCKNIKEMTMRFPGHAKLMEIFRETGLFSKDPVNIYGNQIRPLDLTSKLLFKQWQFREDEEDFTVMRAIVKIGNTNHIMNLYDRFTNGEYSMSRTTGFTCTAVVKAFEEGILVNQFYTPEMIGANCFEYIEEQLKEKGVSIKWESFLQKQL